MSGEEVREGGRGGSPLFELRLYYGRFPLFKRRNFVVGLKIPISTAAACSLEAVLVSMLCVCYVRALNSDGLNERRTQYSASIGKVEFLRRLLQSTELRPHIGRYVEMTSLLLCVTHGGPLCGSRRGSDAPLSFLPPLN